MKYNLPKAIEILERTPKAIEILLQGISNEWAMNNEGDNTFSPYDVVGHLIHGEKTDWMARMEIILSDAQNKAFQPYDRFAQFTESKGKSLEQLIAEFKNLRTENLSRLRSMNISESDLNKTATHPSLGSVTLNELLSTWVVHDLSHLGQIVRVMAKQYKEEVGPWINFFANVNQVNVTIMDNKLVPSSADIIEIVNYKPVYHARFREINEQWINESFVMEEEDIKTLNDPGEHILKNGGRIFIALYNGLAVGTCAYLNMGNDVYEMIKMAVDEKYRGQKIGLRIGEISMQEMKSLGARRIFLYSNTKGSLVAIKLYKKLGFKVIPLGTSEFQRADIKMELTF